MSFPKRKINGKVSAVKIFLKPIDDNGYIVPFEGPDKKSYKTFDIIGLVIIIISVFFDKKLSQVTYRNIFKGST